MRTARVLMVMGTRPEAIKLAPLYRVLKKEDSIELKVCVTGQHRDLLDQLLRNLEMESDWDLGLMQPNQSLSAISAECMRALPYVFQDFNPDLLLVQGDTVSAVVAAWVSFFHKVPIGHIEAGLRTRKNFSPFPEEMNRKMLSCLADLHFCPTERSRKNLMREGVEEKFTFITGNTSIDALRLEWFKNRSFPHLDPLFNGKKLVLVTAHRRENFGEAHDRVFQAIRYLARNFKDYRFVIPVHPNPLVSQSAHQNLEGEAGVSLIPPLDYSELVYLLRNASCVMTDSGGLQEEAPSLGIRTFVLREDTERPEALETPFASRVGTQADSIISQFQNAVLRGEFTSKPFWTGNSPFGDGHAAEGIATVLKYWWHAVNAWSPDLMRECPPWSHHQEIRI